MNKELYIKRVNSVNEQLEKLHDIDFPISCNSIPYIVFYQKPTMNRKFSTYYSEPALNRAECFVEDVKNGNYKKTVTLYHDSFIDGISLFNDFKSSKTSFIEQFISVSFFKGLPIEYRNIGFLDVKELKEFASDIVRFIDYCFLPNNSFNIGIDSSDYFLTMCSYKTGVLSVRNWSFCKPDCLKVLRSAKDKKANTKEIYDACISFCLFLFSAVNQHIAKSVLISKKYRIADNCDFHNCLNIKESCSLLIEELEGDIGSLSADIACNAHALAEYIALNYPKKQSWQKCNELFALLPELKINGLINSKTSILAYICAK